MKRSWLTITMLTLPATVVFLSLGGCGGDGFVAPHGNMGTVSVSATTTGRHIDVDGYTLLINGRPLASFGSNDGALLTRVAPASYIATLSGLAPNCLLVAGDTGRVQVRSRVTTLLSYELACTATERIAFVSERNGRPQIYVMELDGSGQSRLTFDDNSNRDPTWSPDGNKIAFAASPDSMQTNIVIANVDRSAFNSLGGEGARDGYPAWSPDGSQIAFSSLRTGNSELFVMNSDGTNARQITNSPDVDLRPAWSPDGGRLFFDAAPPAPFLLSNLWTINVDGSARTQLTTRPSVRLNPQVSPDGTKIVYQAVFSDSDIYVINVDGSGQTRLTSDLSDERDPYWSADGSRIVFSSNRSGDFEIYVMNLESRNVIRLTNSQGSDYDPVWSR